jgi:outer membrane protein assembly factor BamA
LLLSVTRLGSILLAILVLSVVWGNGMVRASDSAKILKEIRVSELRYTDRDIVTRELVSKVGEPYLEANAEKDLERLDRLGIFSSIEINPIEEDDGVILEIDVKETFPYLPMISIEITDENGLSLGPGFRSVNLFRRGVALSAAARFGGAMNIDVNIKDSWFAGDHLSYEVQFVQRDRVNELDGFNEIATEVYARLGHYLGQNGRIGGLFGFQSLGSDVDGITISDTNRDNIPSVGFFLGYDSRDKVSDPRKGWWNEVDVLRNGGDGNYWRFNIDLRRYQPITERHALSLFSLTTLQTGRVGVDIPVHQDFHIGGTNTLRGWGLGARSGKHQFLNTVEYRYALIRPRPVSISRFNIHLGVQLAAFGDLGLAWNEGNEFKLDNFIDGYGFGIRLLVPFVNVIRLDFAFGEPSEGMRFHIALFEKAVMQRARVR